MSGHGPRPGFSREMTERVLLAVPSPVPPQAPNAKPSSPVSRSISAERASVNSSSTSKNSRRSSLMSHRFKSHRQSVSNTLENLSKGSTNSSNHHRELRSRFAAFVPFNLNSSSRRIGRTDSGSSMSGSSVLGPHREKCTVIQQLVLDMRDCLSHFHHVGDCQATDAELERWAIIIYESMSAPSRTFHGVHHVYEISEGAEPIQKMSAFFHDVIYYSIDGGLSPAQEEVLSGLVEEGKEGAVSLCEGDFDAASRLVIDIFGFAPGQTLNPFSGLNEFLSAALAVRCLKGCLSMASLAKVSACIEATIPFRAPDEDGKTCTDKIFDRLKEANANFELGMDEAEIIEAVQLAAGLANRDVMSFSTPDKAVFLSGTWNLLPESNISLRHGTSFRISDFTFALKKMGGFFSFLKAENIYVSFQNVPSEKEVARLTQRAKENIEVAEIYMRCKLLSISVLYALAEKTGGDAPIAMFLGDLPTAKSVSPIIEDYISMAPPAKSVKLDMRVFNLLRKGRDGESAFDIKNSPLAAYLYALMGDEKMEEALKFAVYPMTVADADKLLAACPPQAVAHIATACAKIALTRASKLKGIASEFSMDEISS